MSAISTAHELRNIWWAMKGLNLRPSRCKRELDCLNRGFLGVIKPKINRFMTKVRKSAQESTAHVAPLGML